MASEPRDTDGDAHRAAIQRQLLDRLLGHQTCVDNLTAPPPDADVDAGHVDGGVASADAESTQDAQHAKGTKSWQPETAPDTTPQPALQPVSLDGQMAEEQQLEPDVRCLVLPEASQAHSENLV